jgi:hypothetical protein
LAIGHGHWHPPCVRLRMVAIRVRDTACRA